jgi:hypothetical protein
MVSNPARPTNFNVRACWGPDMINDHRSEVHRSRPPRFAHVLSLCAKRSHHSFQLRIEAKLWVFFSFLPFLRQGANFLGKHPPLQINVITLGSMGDGLLPVRCQELFCSFSALLVGLWSLLLKTK